jgi:glycine hydroxymethyltransferase
MRRIDALLAKVRREVGRSQSLLHLTANEPLMSDTAREFMGSRISDRYYMGGGDERGVVDFGPFTFLGWPAVQELVSDAEVAARDMLGACAVSLSPLSGVHAMMCTILSVTDPGDAVMSVDLDHGGHFATQRIIERTGRRHLATSYNTERLAFDVERIAHDFAEADASAFYMDASFYLTPDPPILAAGLAEIGVGGPGRWLAGRESF